MINLYILIWSFEESPLRSRVVDLSFVLLHQDTSGNQAVMSKVVGLDGWKGISIEHNRLVHIHLLGNILSIYISTTHFSQNKRSL
jgi:hypothetical protein